jgi:hypothetical protein
MDLPRFYEPSLGRRKPTVLQTVTARRSVVVLTWPDDVALTPRTRSRPTYIPRGSESCLSARAVDHLIRRSVRHPPAGAPESVAGGQGPPDIQISAQTDVSMDDGLAPSPAPARSGTQRARCAEWPIGRTTPEKAQAAPPWLGQDRPSPQGWTLCPGPDLPVPRSAGFRVPLGYRG